jgi:hypothetical protein
MIHVFQNIVASLGMCTLRICVLRLGLKVAVVVCICVMSMMHIETLVRSKSMEIFDELKTILELLVIFTTLSQSPLLLATAVQQFLCTC